MSWCLVDIELFYSHIYTYCAESALNKCVQYIIHFCLIQSRCADNFRKFVSLVGTAIVNIISGGPFLDWDTESDIQIDLRENITAVIWLD